MALKCTFWGLVCPQNESELSHTCHFLEVKSIPNVFRLAKLSLKCDWETFLMISLKLPNYYIVGPFEGFCTENWKFTQIHAFTHFFLQNSCVSIVFTLFNVRAKSGRPIFCLKNSKKWSKNGYFWQFSWKWPF